MVKTVGFDYNEQDSIPRFSASVQLIDAYGKKITSITISSESWTDHKCEPSFKMIELAAQLRAETNIVITQYMNRQNKVIEGGKT